MLQPRKDLQHVVKDRYESWPKTPRLRLQTQTLYLEERKTCSEGAWYVAFRNAWGLDAAVAWGLFPFQGPPSRPATIDHPAQPIRGSSSSGGADLLTLLQDKCFLHFTIYENDVNVQQLKVSEGRGMFRGTAIIIMSYSAAAGASVSCPRNWESNRWHVLGNRSTSTVKNVLLLFYLF